ncbi:MAG: DUF2283 domain-containing protein [Actinobacteria bacterium]|nr:DUF2283 domain-containing protein [Actinomycetota bacterium]
MKITYDSEADALYILLRKGDAASSEDIEEGVTVDFDADGHVLGLEMLDARDRLGVDGLSKITFEDLVQQKSAALSLP